MADKDFVVKNGLVVNTNFSTNGSQITLSTINSTSNGFLATTTSITVGNSSVNSIITPTTFSGKAANSDRLDGVLASGYLTVSGTAADSTKLGGVISSAYVNSTGTYTISGVHTHSANIVITNPAGISANSSYGTAGQFLTTNGTSTYWSSQKLTSNNNGGTGAIQLNDAGNLGSNSSFLYNQTTNTVTIGNTSVSATVNSTVYSGTANNALYLGGVIASSYTNSVNLTANLVPYVNSSQLSANLANYVNTTSQAYDSARLGGVVAANYVANSGNYTIGGALTFINASIHTGNVTVSNSINANGSEGSAGQILTSGGANKNVYWSAATNVAAQYAWTNTHSFSNVVTFNGNAVFANAISANGGYGTLGQQLISGGTGANAYWGFAPGANTAGGTGAVQFWNGTTFGSVTGLTFAATGNNLSVANSISIGGVSINSTSYGGKSADSDKLGGTLAASYALKADVHFIGTTSVALNRASAALNLAGVNIDGTAATITGVYAGSLTSSQITTALTYTPYNSTNPAGYTTNLGTVTQVTGTSPLSSSGGTTPAISIAQAGISASGFLSSTDWNTFNNKQATLPAATSSVSGYLTSTDWTTFNNKLSSISTASASVSGILSSTDWTTFNGKQAALGFTPYNSTNPSGYITSSALTPYAPIASATFTANTTVDRLIATKYQVTKIDNGASGTIDCSTGNYFMVSSGGAVTFVFNNAPVSTYAYSMAIKATITGTITWPVSVKWPSAISPIKSTGIDTWVFLTDDGGTTWRGNLVMKDNR